MKKLVITSVLVSIMSLVGVVILLTKEKDNKTAFFMSAEVYNGFDYKKELDQDLERLEYEINHSIDSLERDLQLSFEYLKSISPSEEQLILYERQQNYYIDFKSAEEQRYVDIASESYGLIWDRINSYVTEYGQDNDYTYIFGANGDGSLMYADDNENITDDILVYVNQRYAGE